MFYSDKIGSANFFWSFPSKVLQDKICQRDSISSQISAARKNIEDMERTVHDLQKSRNGDGREEKLANLEELRRTEIQLDSTLQAGKSNDPEEFRKVSALCDENMSHANRWTDNIWVLKQYLVKAKGMPGKEVIIY